MRGFVNCLIKKEKLLMKCLNDKYESVGPDKVKHWYAWLPVAGTVILDDHIQ